MRGRRDIALLRQGQLQHAAVVFGLDGGGVDAGDVKAAAERAVPALPADEVVLFLLGFFLFLGGNGQAVAVDIDADVLFGKEMCIRDRVSIGCPDAYQPDSRVLEFAAGYGDKFAMTSDCLKAAEGADVIFTDVWASMGQEGEAEKRKIAFAGYQVNEQLLKKAHEGCMVQHLSLIHI